MFCDIVCNIVVDPNEERRLKQVIAAVGNDRFNKCIQDLAELCSKPQISRHKAMFKTTMNSLASKSYSAIEDLTSSRSKVGVVLD